MLKDQPISGRFFLVGCPRSGTTLLQTMLARHSRVFSLPETHFFLRAPARGRLRRLHLASPQARETLQGMLTTLDRPELYRMVPRWSPFLESYARAFCQVLDRLTLEEDKDVWVEKTPDHIRRLDLIEKLVRSARFIHILRDGRDVVASLYEVASLHPEVWGRRTLDSCIDQWNHSLNATLSRLDDPRHAVVSYEELISNPEAELARICRLIGLEVEPQMLQAAEAPEQLQSFFAASPWVGKAVQSLQDIRMEKFSKIFTPDERAYIEERLLYGGQGSRVLHAQAAAGV